MKVADYSEGELPPPAPYLSERQAQGAALGRYQPSHQPRWISLGLIAVIHMAGFYALQHLDVSIVRKLPVAPLVVDLLPLDPPEPESKPVALPTRKVVEQTPKPQPIMVPPPIVAIPAAAAIQTAPKPDPTPPAPVKAVEEAKPAPARASEALANLNTRLLSADPPRYPVQSRRLRETGTVVLMVVVGVDGRVSAISVATSSGSDRLDRAALNAVRRWRWSPTIIDGRPSPVQGLVRIPFELKDS